MARFGRKSKEQEVIEEVSKTEEPKVDVKEKEQKQKEEPKKEVKVEEVRKAQSLEDFLF